MSDPVIFNQQFSYSCHKSSALDTNGIDCNSNICIFAVNALDVQKDQNSGIPTEAQLVQESIELFKLQIRGKTN
jgi:hypothetical protein